MGFTKIFMKTAVKASVRVSCHSPDDLQWADSFWMERINCVAEEVNNKHEKL
jgi:hypothetical protein